MILITGGLGFIGSNTAEALAKMGKSCVLTMHRNNYIPMFLEAYMGKTLFVEPVDILDTESLMAVGNKYPISQIIHLGSAAIGAMDIAEEFRANINGFLNVTEAGRAWNVSRIIVASTIGVYDVDSRVPLQEDEKLHLESMNSIPASKKSYEILGGVISAKTGLDMVFARIGAIWGPRGRARSVFFAAPQLIHAAVRGGALLNEMKTEKIYAGEAIDLCYVKDCGYGLALLATTEKLNHRIYNLGSGKLTTNRQVVDAIAEVIPEVAFQLEDGTRPNQQANGFYFDIQRLQDDTYYESQYDIRGGMPDYIRWLQDGNEK